MDLTALVQFLSMNLNYASRLGIINGQINIIVVTDFKYQHLC